MNDEKLGGYVMKINKHTAKILYYISIIISIIVTFFIVMGIIDEQIQFFIQIILCMIIAFQLWKLRDGNVPWFFTLIDIVCWMTGILCWVILPPYIPMLEDINLYLIMIILVIYVINTTMISRIKKARIEKEANDENDENVVEKHVGLRFICFLLFMYVSIHVIEFDIVRNLVYTTLLLIDTVSGFHDMYEKCENEN